jgi:beta-alanine degradation protein BauB
MPAARMRFMPRPDAGSGPVEPIPAGTLPRMPDDPVRSNPDLYRVVMENDRVRVLEYHDRPGDRTRPHGHPDSVMITMSSFRRRLSRAGAEVDVELEAGTVRWLDAQEHTGENIGDTETRSFFVELKEPPPIATDDPARLGPREG